MIKKFSILISIALLGAQFAQAADTAFEQKLSRSFGQLKKNISQLDVYIENTRANVKTSSVNKLQQETKKYKDELSSLNFIANTLLADFKKAKLSQYRKNYFTNEFRLFTGLSNSLEVKIQLIEALAFNKEIQDLAVRIQDKIDYLAQAIDSVKTNWTATDLSQLIERCLEFKKKLDGINNLVVQLNALINKAQSKLSKDQRNQAQQASQNFTAAYNSLKQEISQLEQNIREFAEFNFKDQLKPQKVTNASTCLSTPQFATRKTVLTQAGPTKALENKISCGVLPQPVAQQVTVSQDKVGAIHHARKEVKLANASPATAAVEPTEFVAAQPVAQQVAMAQDKVGTIHHARKEVKLANASPATAAIDKQTLKVNAQGVKVVKPLKEQVVASSTPVFEDQDAVVLIAPERAQLDRTSELQAHHAQADVAPDNAKLDKMPELQAHRAEQKTRPTIEQVVASNTPVFEDQDAVVSIAPERAQLDRVPKLQAHYAQADVAPDHAQLDKLPDLQTYRAEQKIRPAIEQVVAGNTPVFEDQDAVVSIAPERAQLDRVPELQAHHAQADVAPDHAQLDKLPELQAHRAEQKTRLVIEQIIANNTHVEQNNTAPIKFDSNYVQLKEQLETILSAATFKCNICSNFESNDQDKLAKHIKDAHNRLTLKKYSCYFCNNFASAYKTRCRNHMLTTHAEEIRSQYQQIHAAEAQPKIKDKSEEQEIDRNMFDDILDNPNALAELKEQVNKVDEQLNDEVNELYQGYVFIEQYRQEVVEMDRKKNKTSDDLKKLERNLNELVVCAISLTEDLNRVLNKFKNIGKDGKDVTKKIHAVVREVKRLEKKLSRKLANAKLKAETKAETKVEQVPVKQPVFPTITTEETPKLLSCPFNCMKFTSQARLDEHIKTKHGTQNDSQQDIASNKVIDQDLNIDTKDKGKEKIEQEDVAQDNTGNVLNESLKSSSELDFPPNWEEANDLLQQSETETEESAKLLKMQAAILILGLDEEDTKEEAIQKRKKLLLKYHPDKNQTPFADEISRKINEAFDVLFPGDVELQEDKDEFQDVIDRLNNKWEILGELIAKIRNDDDEEESDNLIEQFKKAKVDLENDLETAKDIENQSEKLTTVILQIFYQLKFFDLNQLYQQVIASIEDERKRLIENFNNSKKELLNQLPNLDKIENPGLAQTTEMILEGIKFMDEFLRENF